MSEAAHVLVVDDDREIRGLLRDYLEKNGFKATAVGGAAEARLAASRGTTTTPHRAATPVADVLDGLSRTLAQIYVQRDLEIDVEAQDKVQFRGERQR